MAKKEERWSTDGLASEGNIPRSESRELVPLSRNSNLPIANPTLPVAVSTGQVQSSEVPKARGRQFSPGVSGNPAGRPRGSKNKLTELFLKTIVDDFAEFGAEAISHLRKRDPATYLRLIAFLVPRDLVLKREQGPDYDYASMAEHEIVDLLNERRREKMIADMMKQAE